MDARTDQRSTVRVLLRGFAASEATQRRIDGYVVYIAGDVTEGIWPPGTAQPGDIEGIVWTTPRQVTSVMRNLRANASVVAVYGNEKAADDDA